jgi:hypothetical protein
MNSIEINLRYSTMLFSYVCYSASNGRMIANDELATCRGLFEVLFQNLPGGTVTHHLKAQDSRLHSQESIKTQEYQPFNRDTRLKH